MLLEDKEASCYVVAVNLAILLHMVMWKTENVPNNVQVKVLAGLVSSVYSKM